MPFPMGVTITRDIWEHAIPHPATVHLVQVLEISKMDAAPACWIFLHAHMPIQHVAGSGGSGIERCRSRTVWRIWDRHHRER